MVGKFRSAVADQWQGDHGLRAVALDPGDEGMTVQIDATVAQNGNEVKCNGNFTAPKKGEATFPFLTAWSMTVDVRDLAPGWAHGEGVAKNRGNVKSDWETPDPEAIPAERRSSSSGSSQSTRRPQRHIESGGSAAEAGRHASAARPRPAPRRGPTRRAAAPARPARSSSPAAGRRASSRPRGPGRERPSPRRSRSRPPAG